MLRHSLAARNLAGSFSEYHLDCTWKLQVTGSPSTGCDAPSLGLRLEDQGHPVANEKVDHDLSEKRAEGCVVLQKNLSFRPKDCLAP